MNAKKSFRGLPTSAPEKRGPLLTDADVAKLLKLDNPESESVRKWVRANVPNKKRIGHNTVRWFEADVLTWVASTGDAA
jgi:predicted DNA-binding transcriptional regulator AlpA